MNSSVICMACNEVGHISTRCPELHSSLNKGFYEGQRIADDDDHDHESIFPDIGSILHTLYISAFNIRLYI